MILDHSDLKCISEKGQYFNFFAILRRKFLLTWNTLTEHFMYSLGESLKSFLKFHYTSRNWFFMSYPEIKLNSFFQGKE